jgi:hypothetical protein
LLPLRKSAISSRGLLTPFDVADYAILAQAVETKRNSLHNIASMQEEFENGSKLAKEGLEKLIQEAREEEKEKEKEINGLRDETETNEQLSKKGKKP